MSYVPERGDLVWVSFNPQVGHEQAGRRPALVLSPSTYNDKVGLAIVCPITNQRKGYTFEVVIPTGFGIKGVILSDQIRSIDWRGRQAEFAGKLSGEALKEVLRKLNTLLGD